MNLSKIRKEPLTAMDLFKTSRNSVIVIAVEALLQTPDEVLDCAYSRNIVLAVPIKKGKRESLIPAN